jgi:nucleoid DNA-binding protein
MADNKTAKVKAATKTQVQQTLSEKTGLTRKQVGMFLDELESLIKRELTKGPGVFTIPGMIKIKKVKKAATKARQGRNPQTGETITIKAKPARTVVKTLPLKGLKEVVK